MKPRLLVPLVGLVLAACGAQSAKTAADTSAPADTTANTATDGAALDAPLDSAADATSADTASAPGSACPKCPEGQKCRPDLAICVGAGIVACQPACPASLICRLQPPPACVQQSCALPSQFSADVLKLTSLSLDSDSAACKGATGNALAKLAAQVPLVQKLLNDAVASDQATVLLEPTGLTPQGGTGALRWLFGTRSFDNLKCNPASQQAYCSYTASPTCWDRTTTGNGACAAWMQLPVTWLPPLGTASLGALQSDAAPLPPGDLLQFAVPLANGAQVLLQLMQPRLQAL